MTAARLLPLDVTKEVRALLPTWLACTAAVTVAAIFSNGQSIAGGTALRAGVLAYILGCAALGALSIGHEYSNRTLPLLLSLPTSRPRIFRVKLAVLTAMLLALGAVALVGLLGSRARSGPSDIAVIIVLALSSGLFVAPWLTMVCRNPLAGAVFAIGVPGLMLVGGQVVAILTYGTSPAHTPAADRLQLAVASWGILLTCAAGAVASWRMFMRLEAIDGRDSHMRLPRWLRDRTAAAVPGIAPGRRAHPVWLLAKKEFRLQYLTLVVAGLYVLGWLAILLLRRAVGGALDQPLVVLTLTFGAAVAMLSGSVASAEERQFGTLESQVLLPMATAKQWAVKASMALGLTLVLAAGLPMLLGYISLNADDLRINPWYVVTAIVIAAGSLYVSTLCSTGLRALLLSLPVFLTIFVLFKVLVSWLHGPASGVLMLGLAAMFVALVSRFGLINHRSSERGAARIWRQVAWMAGSMACAVVSYAGVMAYVTGSSR